MGVVTIANLYPVMLQRYNRARIYNTIEEKIEASKIKDFDCV